MSTSQTQANIDLDADYGSGTPATVYAALATTTPVLTGAGSVVEPSGTTQYISYARVAITNNATNWPNASGGAKANGTVITFPTSAGGSASPVTVTALVFWTTADSSGRILDSLPLPSGTTIGAGTALTFPIGSVTITQS